MSSPSDVTMYPSSQPSQVVENEKWNDELYWKSNVRWVCSMYNPLTVPYTVRGDSNIDPLFGSVNRFVTQYIKYARYIFGWQYGTSYELTAKDAKNNNTQIPLYRGKDIISLFNFFTGKFMEMIKPIPDVMNAYCISGEALSRKTLQFDVIKNMIAAKNFLKYEQQLGNIEIGANSYLDISEESEIDLKFESFVEGSERTYLKFAKNFYISNEAAVLLLKGAQYGFVGGRSIAFVEERNGQIFLDIVPPEYSIVDMSKNDDQHRSDSFAGQIRPYSVSEIAAKWKLTKEEAEDLDKIARDSNSQIPYVQGWVNLAWYQTYGNVPKVWVAEKIQWQSIVYINGEPVSCVRQATLIGNKILKDQKIVEGSLVDKRDKRERRLNYIICTPNTLLNTNLSVVGMIHEMQDIKDSLITNMLSSINRAMGKAVYIDTSQLPENLRTPDFLQQLKQHGVVAGNRTEIDDIQKTNPLIEVLDLTLDPNIINLLNMVSYWDNAIQDVLNVPKSVKSGTTTYQSKGQLQANATTSEVGTLWLYGSLLKWIENIVEFGADMHVQAAAKGGEEVAVMVGDTMSQLLKVSEIQECLNSDYKFRINFDNTLTQEAKETLAAMAIQSAGVNPNAELNYLKVLKSKNINDLENYLEAEKAKAEKIAAEERKQAAIQQQNALQAQQNIVDTQSNAKLEADKMKLDAEQQNIILEKTLEGNNTNG